MDMKKIATALVIALLAILVMPVSHVRAQDYNASQLEKVKAVEVSVIDGVKDGCLPNPRVLKTEAELILRRSGIEVEAGLTSHTLQISATGFELKRGSTRTPVGTCVAALEVMVFRWEGLFDQSAGTVIASSYTNVLVGDKETFQNDLRNSVNEEVTAVANEILKARANASSKSQ